ncbi:MAG: cation diffusion facilitator family transporter [Telluria sp.]
MAESGKAVYAALAGNVLIAISKFVAAAYTGSSAILSEGVHSLVDCGNEVLLLYGMKRAKLPADQRFPFGHGKEIYFWSFVVALLVFALGAGVSLYEGIRHLRHPAQVEEAWINYLVIGVAMVFEGGSWFVAFREFRREKGEQSMIDAVHRAKDPTTFTVLFEDSAALLGLVVALAGVALGQWTGNPVWDGIASIAIALILAGTAFWLAKETKSLLIGESANLEVVAGIRGLLEDQPQIDAVNEILTMHMGPDFILVNISVHVADAAGRQQVHQLFSDIDAGIKQRFPKVRRVFIESVRDTETEPEVPLPPLEPDEDFLD